MKLKDILKGNKKLLLVAIILITISIVLFYFSIYLESSNKEETTPLDYNLLIAEEADIEDKYVEVTIIDIPYNFAIEENDGYDRKYYFVYDENNYMYITRLTDSTYTKLENMYNEKKEEFSYTLEGYIFDLPEEVKELAKTSYNEAMGEEYINDSNFRLYFGNTYLDETLTPNTNIIAIMSGAGIGVACAAIVFLGIYIAGVIKIKMALKKYYKDDIEYELSKETVISNKKEEIFLTDKYVISTALGLTVLEYDEIVWLHNEKRTYNSIPIGIYLMAYTDKNKKIQIATTYSKEEKLIEIIEKIKEKNPNIMVGFSQENQQKYKEMKKNNKEAKKL